MFRYKYNMGKLDRIVRLILGPVVVIIGPLTDLVNTDFMSNIILSLFGVIMFFSALTGYCFMYDIAGINTRK